MKPSWLIEAEKHVGVTEIKGTKHNSVIVGWLKSLKAWWSDDETPWCGVFVGHCLKATGHVVPTNWMRAKAYLSWGTILPKPAVGCIAVKSRTGGGHVTFIVGKDAQGRLLGLGGNQGDAVHVSAFEANSFEGFRWPSDTKELPDFNLPIGKAGTITTEA